jgi:apolipoprotein N-acyltransferase
MLKSWKLFLLILGCCSGLILSLAWPERGFPGLLFIGLVPLLFIEEIISKNRDRFNKFSVLLYSLPAFIIWNGLTTWWIYNSTGIGAILAIVLNSLFMSIVFQMFHYSKTRLKSSFAGYTGLIFYWISFEYLHLNWDLNWPWLNIGNGFASYYKWVQWYEYTGALGGTLWVLAANILMYTLLKSLGARYWVLGTRDSEKSNDREPRRKNRVPILMTMPVLILWITLPILFSLSIYSAYREKYCPVSFVVVQPNLDPYNEQYKLPPSEVIRRVLKLSSSMTDNSTNFLIAPESAIQEEMWDDHLSSFNSIKMLKGIIQDHPSLNIIIGASTFYEFKEGEIISRTARKFMDAEKYYEAYNTAILINSSDSLQLYHKSKLTPGVEILPSFPGSKWLEKFSIDLGGTVGSLGTDKVRKVLKSTNSVNISPTICYESIFGEFFSEFVRNGAQIMCIITNDGWWGNTPGHRQHFAFAHLRAIETRRSIARSANTGISAFIDQRGDAHQVTKYWEPAVIKSTINANSSLTFYVRHGDYIARGAVICGSLLLVLSVIMGFINRKKQIFNTCIPKNTQEQFSL